MSYLYLNPYLCTWIFDIKTIFALNDTTRMVNGLYGIVSKGVRD